MKLTEQLTELLGPRSLAVEDVDPPWGRDRSPLAGGEPAAVVLPRSTEDVAKLVRWARRAGVALVPAGGRSGYSGGAVASDGQVVVGLERMNRLLAWHPAVPAVTVEAGMVTRDLQRAAAAEGWFFPIDFAACDRSQIGGNVATNAGGIRVLRYGMTGDWVLGLTVVTGTGEVLSTGSVVPKDNTGPPLKHLFVGSEGTLGIITQVTLRLTRPPAPERQLAVLAATDLESILTALESARRLRGTPLAFECFDAACHRLMANRLGGPLVSGDPPYLCLAELEVVSAADRAAAEEWLQDCCPSVEGTWIHGADERKRAWAYRLGISDALAHDCRVHKNDLSVPLDLLPVLDGELRQLATDLQLPVVLFGHVGDGNLHVNLLRPQSMNDALFTDACARFDAESYRRVAELGGSISAEHGIGRLKRRAAHLARSSEERKALNDLRRIFDPDGILNPGVGPY